MNTEPIDTLAQTFLFGLVFCSLLTDVYVFFQSSTEDKQMKKRIDYYSDVYKAVTSVGLNQYEVDKDGTILIENSENISTKVNEVEETLKKLEEEKKKIEEDLKKEIIIEEKREEEIKEIIILQNENKEEEIQSTFVVEEKEKKKKKREKEKEREKEKMINDLSISSKKEKEEKKIKKKL